MYNVALTVKQKEAVRAFVRGNDNLVSFPTKFSVT